MAGVPYTMYFANGQKKNGTLDANGMADERNLPDAITKVIYHNSPSTKDEARPTVDALLNKLDSLIDEESNLVFAQQQRGGK